jgi:hypothetical protein
VFIGAEIALQPEPARPVASIVSRTGNPGGRQFARCLSGARPQFGRSRTFATRAPRPGVVRRDRRAAWTNGLVLGRADGLVSARLMTFMPYEYTALAATPERIAKERQGRSHIRNHQYDSPKLRKCLTTSGSGASLVPNGLVMRPHRDVAARRTEVR